MRKIIVTEFITLDGVVEAPGGDETAHPHGGWQARYRSPEGGKYKMDELKSVDSLLLGKNTYSGFRNYWPTQTGNDFADRMNHYPKYVVSATLPNADWNNSHIIRDMATELAALKNTQGGNILVYGSATLVKSLLQHNLIDELHLMLIPVVVGGGLKLFDDNLQLRNFSLSRSQAFENGVVVLEYQLLP
ncbi:dihydrofolate reductase family protein [Emticicia sp. 21SJ11W-3]|uniref:dihydrofolate reductase family protein n=1 Tax=Emticicia sp. 21SJ11W-3 TaxID=2916755 RepID=UPI00209F8AFD|nr:dihydrofolate reductase family protein [Emticicia sp. 21SJ11W-3]UTA66862.1 dihydrofolate reductase family protein [Emticicia sp. 21SJ11W-3]